MRSIEEVIRKFNTICWYPSAGSDFRVLLFLSEKYCEREEVSISGGRLPDLFILSDCKPGNFNFSNPDYGGWSYIETINDKNPFRIGSFDLHYDRKTVITATSVKVLDRLDLPNNEELYKFSNSKNYGWSFLFKVHVKSKQLGEWDTNVLYVLAENTWFALRYLLPRKINIDYLVRVRYGEGFGGSILEGEWLLKLIPHLNVKYYLTDEVIEDSSFEYIPKELEEDFADLSHIWNSKEKIPMECFYNAPGLSWTGHSYRDVHWYRVKDNMRSISSENVKTINRSETSTKTEDQGGALLNTES